MTLKNYPHAAHFASGRWKICAGMKLEAVQYQQKDDPIEKAPQMTNTSDTSPEAVERLILGPLTEIAGSKGMPVTDDDVDTCKLVAATLRALSAERDALKAELARLRVLMEARDSFDRGEPSQPPETGVQKRAFIAHQKETNT